MDFLAFSYYPWVQAFHVLSIMIWMAGMFLLPHLFSHHAEAKIGSELSETLKIMERRLLLFIITPAMSASFISGGFMLLLDTWQFHLPWTATTPPAITFKFTAILLLAVMRALYAHWYKIFKCDKNTRSACFYQMWNAVPIILMIFIIIISTSRPFS